MKNTTLIVVLIFIACQPQQQNENSAQVEVKEVVKDPNKIYNFMNQELPPKQLSQETSLLFNQNLEEARIRLEADPDSLDLIIWFGRRTAYLGKYLEAINVYSDGLVKYPNSYRLRRHRGHRYITTRQLDKALKDYEMAAYYSVNVENNIEPDGLPNKLNQPLGNDKFNIWYHFGLAHYLNGRFDKALSSYNRCMEYSDNDDLLVATTYWKYLTLNKLGNVELANQLLEETDLEMEIIENDAYLKLLKLYKKEIDPEALTIEATSESGELDPTIGYGIGSFYQHQSRFAKANQTFLNVLESPSWDAFGFIASEAELKTIFPVP